MFARRFAWWCAVAAENRTVVLGEEVRPVVVVDVAIAVMAVAVIAVIPT